MSTSVCSVSIFVCMFMAITCGGCGIQCDTCRVLSCKGNEPSMQLTTPKMTTWGSVHRFSQPPGNDSDSWEMLWNSSTQPWRLDLTRIPTETCHLRSLIRKVNAWPTRPTNLFTPPEKPLQAVSQRQHSHLPSGTGTPSPCWPPFTQPWTQAHTHTHTDTHTHQPTPEQCRKMQELSALSYSQEQKT